MSSATLPANPLERARTYAAFVRFEHTLFSLPPRYRGHEAIVARAYLMGGGVRPAGLRKAWSALREMLGGRAVKPVAAG